MTRLLILIVAIGLLASCRSTKKIQTAIAKKDSVVTVTLPPDVSAKNDTLEMIRATLQQVNANQISYRTFSAKVQVDYRGSDGKNYDVNANIRMFKDSALWINVNAFMGIDAMRVLITKDSVKLLNKLEKVYTERSVEYLQEVTGLPLDLKTVQDLLIGNAVFLDSNIVSYRIANNTVSMLSLGKWFKNLVTFTESDKILMNAKLDDVDISRSRTAALTYSDYENKKGVPFSTKRSITVTEKNRLDIKLEFKQYEFNQEVSFPFSVPKNYDRN
jgi:hypothetical protein